MTTFYLPAACKRLEDAGHSPTNAENFLLRLLQDARLTAHARYAHFRADEKPKSNVEIPVEVWHFDIPAVFDLEIDWGEGSLKAASDAVPVLWARRIYLDRAEFERCISPPVAMPAQDAQNVPHEARRRGRTPDISERVLREMKEMSPVALRAMKEKDLQMKFGASRDTCRRVRDAVLVEIKG